MTGEKSPFTLYHPTELLTGVPVVSKTSGPPTRPATPQVSAAAAAAVQQKITSDRAKCFRFSLPLGPLPVGFQVPDCSAPGSATTSAPCRIASNEILPSSPFVVSEVSRCMTLRPTLGVL